jgi:UDP-4-amino-4,6-dideoxy-N-acetyl-beta-L-altrosamine N-acetyltransferase
VISLRALDEGDRDRLFVWRNLDEVRKWMYTDHVIPRDEHDQWFDSVLRDSTKKYWVILVDDVPVGVANLVRLVPHEASCSFGIYIAEPTARGTGAGAAGLLAVLSYAFSIAGVDTVEAEVFADNQPARALYERLGMRCVGQLRRTGLRAEVLTMRITRDEWDLGASELVGDITAYGLVQ